MRARMDEYGAIVRRLSEKHGALLVDTQAAFDAVLTSLYPATLGWDRYAGSHGKIMGMHTFGASAPMKSLLEKFGFTPDGVLKAAREQLAAHATMAKAAE